MLTPIVWGQNWAETGKVSPINRNRYPGWLERGQERKESGIKRYPDVEKESAICDAVSLSLELGRRQFGRETDQDYPGEFEIGAHSAPVEVFEVQPECSSCLEVLEIEHRHGLHV